MITYSDDSEKPHVPHIVSFFETCKNKKELDEKILELNKLQKILHDWLLERDRCLWCHGSGEPGQFDIEDQCPECFGSGKESDRQRKEKMSVFK
jgi:hypothetical protein